MIMRRFVLAAVAAAATMACSAQAQQQAYDCNMQSKDVSGFVGDRMFVGINPQENRGVVADRIILAVHGTPVEASIRKRNETVWKLQWFVKAEPTSSRASVNLIMRANFNSRSGRLIINGQISGADNVISAQAQCKPTSRDAIRRLRRN